MDNSLKKRFPLLADSDVGYFDYAATAPMPDSVISAWTKYQCEVGVFVGKGGGRLSRLAQKAFEESENVLRTFFHARKSDVFVYGKNVTELINILALSIEDAVKPMDAIVVGPYEHHSNVLPWKYLAKRRGGLFFEMPIRSDGRPDFESLGTIPARVRVFAFSSVANSNGHRFDIERALSCLSAETLVFEDASQSVAHEGRAGKKGVSCVFVPSHKMYGPKNIAGALVDESLLGVMRPVLLGGGMVDFQGFEDSWKKGSGAFLAGTYDIGLIAAWAEAAKFLESISFDFVREFEKTIHGVVRNGLSELKRIRVLSTAGHDAIIPFVFDGIHAHDVAHYLGERDVVVRAGNLCATGAMRRMGFHAITRVSLGLGVDAADIDRLVRALLDLDAIGG